MAKISQLSLTLLGQAYGTSYCFTFKIYPKSCHHNPNHYHFGLSHYHLCQEARASYLVSILPPYPCLVVAFDQLTDNPSSLESFCTWLPATHSFAFPPTSLVVPSEFSLLVPPYLQGSELGFFSLSTFMHLGS